MGRTLGSERMPGNWKLSKMNQKCFLFYLKSYFRSENIYIFVLTVLVMQENFLVSKLRLISKLMAPQTGKQIINN